MRVVNLDRCMAIVVVFDITVIQSDIHSLMRSRKQSYFENVSLALYPCSHPFPGFRRCFSSYNWIRMTYLEIMIMTLELQGHSLSVAKWKLHWRHPFNKDNMRWQRVGNWLACLSHVLPVPMRLFSGYAGFFPHSKNTHDRLINHSKLSLGVFVSPNGLLVSACPAKGRQPVQGVPRLLG